MGPCENLGLGGVPASKIYTPFDAYPNSFVVQRISLAGVSQLVSHISCLLSSASAFLINATRPTYKFVSEMRIGHFA